MQKISFLKAQEIMATTKTLQIVEHEYILEVLKKCSWNRTLTAQALAISLRTVRSKIKQMKSLGYEILNKDE